MTTITFENSSKPKRIGERAFAGSHLRSITIPASTEEIDGSALGECRRIEIEVATGSRNSMIEFSSLVTTGGTEIV
jgi:hypothetical protein